MAQILVVDDDNDFVGVLGDLLRAEKHVVQTAATGEEGLAVLRSDTLPDVLVLDVDMPVMGGPEMAHEMLLHDAGEQFVPIILVSGSDELPKIAKRLGTPYYLAKPCSLAPFLALLDRALAERRRPLSA